MFGKLRGVVSSVKSKKPNITIQTPSAVAGIRGTDFFLEIGKNRKAKTEAEKKQMTKVACLSGNCLTGSLPRDKKKSSIIFEKLASLLEGTAFAADNAKVDLVQVPAGTSVSVQKGMNLKDILKSAKKIPASMKAKIKSKTPASESEHAEAATSQAMEIDAGSTENQQAEIESGDEPSIIDDQAPAEIPVLDIPVIIRKTKVTIIIDLTGI
jgi:hypothetical protein